MKVDVVEEVKSIVCNASNLNVSAATVETDAGELLMPEVKADQETESLSLLLAHNLQKGPAMVTYTFTGVLNDQMRGFYRSKYTMDGEERYMAVTQFESTDARQAFPCWDEPAVKATFDMIIAGPTDRVILSNMPEVSCVEDKDDSSTKVVSFATTPVMSTYLVAIVVGEFDYVEGVSEEGITCRVYSPKGKKEQGQFALECGLRSLTYYSNSPALQQIKVIFEELPGYVSPRAIPRDAADEVHRVLTADALADAELERLLQQSLLREGG